MITLTADDSMLLKDVGMFVEPVELYHPNGKYLGLFVPASLERGKELYAKAEAETDWAEIERRSRSRGKAEPFEVALARLKMLEAEVERRKAAGEPELTPDEGVAYFASLRERGVPSQSVQADCAGQKEMMRCASP